MSSPFTPAVEAWRTLLEQHAHFGDPSRDTDRLLAWITEESGGNPAALGAPYEVGIFQLDLEDGPAWGGTIQTLHGNFTDSATSQSLNRPLTDDEKLLQVTTGLAYVAHARSTAQAVLDQAGLTWSDDDIWCLTKLHHALPVLLSSFVPACAAKLGTGITWSDFRGWCEKLSASDVAAINDISRYMPFGRLFDNAEKVGYLPGPDGSAG